jgi:hypothetical protein
MPDGRVMKTGAGEPEASGVGVGGGGGVMIPLGGVGAMRICGPLGTGGIEGVTAGDGEAEAAGAALVAGAALAGGGDAVFA